MDFKLLLINFVYIFLRHPVDEIMTRNCDTHLLLQVLFLMIRDMTSFYNINLLFFSTSGPANYELLSYQYTGCPKKNFDCLISCKLKTTVFTRSGFFLFSKSSHSNLKWYKTIENRLKVRRAMATES